MTVYDLWLIMQSTYQINRGNHLSAVCCRPVRYISGAGSTREETPSWIRPIRADYAPDPTLYRRVFHTRGVYFYTRGVSWQEDAGRSRTLLTVLAWCVLRIGTVLGQRLMTFHEHTSTHKYANWETANVANPESDQDARSQSGAGSGKVRPGTFPYQCFSVTK